MQKYKDVDGHLVYCNKTIMPSGQTAFIAFDESWSKRKWYYSIYFSISNKRKDIWDVDFKTTGKDGLKGLLWAKNQILEFESYIKDLKGHDVPLVLYCHWDDNRRRDVYYYSLSKIGYNYDRVLGYKAIAKQL